MREEVHICDTRSVRQPYRELSESSVPMFQLLGCADWRTFFDSRGFVGHYPEILAEDEAADEAHNEILDEVSRVACMEESMRPNVEVRTRNYVSEHGEAFVLAWLVFRNYGTVTSGIRSSLAYLTTTGAVEWLGRQYQDDGRRPYLLVVDADDRSGSGYYWQNVFADYRPVDLQETPFGDEVVMTVVVTLYHTEEQMLALTRSENYKEHFTRMRSHLLQLYVQYRDMVVVEHEVLENRVLNIFGPLLVKIYQLSLRYSELKLKVQLIQKSLKRQTKPDFEWIEREVKRQLMYMYDDLAKKEVELASAREHVVEEDGTLNEVRELYRALMSRLLPDLNPADRDYEQELYHKSEEAYEHNDVQQLRSLWNHVRITDIGLAMPEYSDDDMEQVIQQIKQQTEKYERLIEEKTRHYPFTYRETLSSDEKVAENLRMLQEQADDLLVQLGAYQRKYNDLIHEYHEKNN